MEQNDIYNEFYNLTGCSDREIAYTLLSENNWDLGKAFQAYETRPVNPAAAEPSLGQYIKGALTWIFSSSKKPEIKDFESYLKNLGILNYPRIASRPVKTISKYTQSIGKAALVYIHQAQNDRFIGKLLTDPEIISLVNSNFVFVAVLADSSEGTEAISQFSDENIPVFIILNGTQILARLEYFPDINELLDLLLSFTVDDWAEERLIREQQENELKQAEMLQLKIQEDQRKEQVKSKYIYEDQIQVTQRLEPEPEAGPNSAQVIFRLPNGEKLERRFKKDSNSESLLLFLSSVGCERCELLTGYPPTLIGNKTLEEEGLVPRGLIHVRIID